MALAIHSNKIAIGEWLYDYPLGVDGEFFVSVNPCLLAVDNSHNTIDEQEPSLVLHVNTRYHLRANGSSAMHTSSDVVEFGGSITISF